MLRLRGIRIVSVPHSLAFVLARFYAGTDGDVESALEKKEALRDLVQMAVNSSKAIEQALVPLTIQFRQGERPFG
jgi:hypothetical protein